MTLPIIDFVFIAIVVVFAILAGIKGFVGEVFDRGAPVISVWIAVLTYKMVSAPLQQHIQIVIAAHILAFVLVFILAFVFIKVVQQIVGKLVEGKILKQLDHTLGFAFGLLEGLAVVALILLILIFQPWFKLGNLLDGSIFASTLAKILDAFNSLPADSAAHV